MDLFDEIKTELHLLENGHSNERINKNPEVIDKIIEFLKTERLPSALFSNTK